MKLNEWQYAQENQVSQNSTSASSTSFKKRFNKLIQYYGQNLPAEIDYIMVGLLTNDKLEFVEHYNDGATVEFKISIDPATEAWSIKYYVNKKLIDDISGTGWSKFLDTLRVSYIDEVPVTGTPEYKNLLTEWIVKKNNTSSQSASSGSSKTNKEKFKELTDYMIKNKSSSVYKAEVVRLDEGGFTYKEYRKSPSGQDFTFTLLLGYSRFGPQWKYELYMDTDLEAERSGNGFNYLLFDLYKYFKVPQVGTSEHESICESASVIEDFELYENLWN